jgi:hypothetical protein
MVVFVETGHNRKRIYNPISATKGGIDESLSHPFFDLERFAIAHTGQYRER